MYFWSVTFNENLKINMKAWYKQEVLLRTFSPLFSTCDTPSTPTPNKKIGGGVDLTILQENRW